MDLLTRILSRMGVKVYQITPPSPAQSSDAPNQTPQVEATDPTDMAVEPINLAMLAGSQPSIVQAIRSDSATPGMIQPLPLNPTQRWNPQGMRKISSALIATPEIEPDSSVQTGFNNRMLAPDYQPGPYSKIYGAS